MVEKKLFCNAPSLDYIYSKYLNAENHYGKLKKSLFFGFFRLLSI